MDSAEGAAMKRPRALSAVGTGDPYAQWDAAYVLGSLSSADRREFEAHMSGCPSCRKAVGELSGMPALLSRIDHDEAAAIDESESGAAPPLNPRVLTSLLEKVGRRRRRRRLATWTAGAAAAAVLVAGAVVAMQSQPVAPVAPYAASSATMTPAGSTELTSTVTIIGQGWGTRIEMNCSYEKLPNGTPHDGDEAGDNLAMVVVGRDGSHSRLATWVAVPGVTATPSGSTSMPVDHIAAVQIVSDDTGNVMLQRSL
jgi:anti-sigma factor RsiW